MTLRLVGDDERDDDGEQEEEEESEEDLSMGGVASQSGMGIQIAGVLNDTSAQWHTLIAPPIEEAMGDQERNRRANAAKRAASRRSKNLQNSASVRAGGVAGLKERLVLGLSLTHRESSFFGSLRESKIKSESAAAVADSDGTANITATATGTSSSSSSNRVEEQVEDNENGVNQDEKQVEEIGRSTPPGRRRKNRCSRPADRQR